MKLFFIALVASVLFSSIVRASCKSDFSMLQDKKKVQLVNQGEKLLRSKAELSKLKSAELKAVKNYIQYLSFQFDGENSLYISTDQYQLKSDKSSLGYRILVSDGGDESNVTYYIKIDVGTEDVAYPILYRYFDNQSPERDWLCEKI